jgi:hypothetical protein
MDKERFTGEHCSPEKRKAIVEGIKSHTSIQELAKQTKSSPHTVMVVRDQELPDWRKVQSKNLERFSGNVIQSLLAMTPEQLNETGLSERCVALGIVMDKKAMLDGEPTAIVEHRHTVDVHALRDSLDSHDVIDVTPVQTLNHGYTVATDTTHTAESTVNPESQVGSQTQEPTK